MKKMRKKGPWFYLLVCAVLTWFFRIVYRLHIEGEENEPEESGYLVCANHISAIDPILLTIALHRQVCFMSKKELFKIPVLAQLIRALGAFPVDRKSGDVGAVKHSIRLLKSGRSVGLFPQGTRHPNEDPRTTEVRNGAAMIAAHTEATVLPMYIHRKDFSAKPFRKTTIVIGKPIPFSEFGYDPEKKGEYSRISHEIFDRICALDKELTSCDR